MKRNRRLLRASEIGEYVYCRRAWWLRRVQELEPENRRQLEAGIARHAAHGRAVRCAALFYRTGYVLLAAAATLSVVVVVLSLVLAH